MTFDEILTVVGSPVLSLLLFFAINKIWPEFMANQRENRDEERRERRELIDIIRQNTQAYVELREGIKAQTQLLTRQSDTLAEVTADVADIRTHLKLPRRSQDAKGTV